MHLLRRPRRRPQAVGARPATVCPSVGGALSGPRTRCFFSAAATTRPPNLTRACNGLHLR